MLLGPGSRAQDAAQPGLRSEAPSPVLVWLVETLFTFDASMPVYVTPRSQERPGGVEYVKTD